MPRAEEAARADAEASEDEFETISPQELNARLGRTKLDEASSGSRPTRNLAADQVRNASAESKAFTTPAERMAVEQVAKFEILPEHIKALVPAKPLELCGMNTAIHARSERATFETVAAEIASAKAGCHRARLDDLGHGLRADGLRADPGQGRGLVCCRRCRAGWQPNSPEDRALGQPCGLLPRLERMHGAEFGIAVGQGGPSPASVCSPLVCGRVSRMPRSVFSRCSKRMAASSERRNAPAKPTRRMGPVA